MNKASVESTSSMTKEDLSGHMNEDYTLPSKRPTYKTPGPGRLRGVEQNTARGVKESVTIQDVSADKHEDTSFQQIVHGEPFRVREGE
jgi:hypothetical protein